jgi:TRAP-type uncharacterized transport system substrate-binding protein
MARKSAWSQIAEAAMVLIPIGLLLAGAVWLALRFADPVPKTFVVSSASKGSPYHQLAERYGATFAKNGIRLVNRESDGSVANMKALGDPAAGVQAGFVQGGLFAAKDAPDVVSIGRVAHEPLWVFHHGSVKVERLGDLLGKRVLVGPAGGGTHGLALRLLAANGVTADNTTLINRSLPDYVDLLGKGEADAGFLVLAAEARTIQRLLATTDVRLFSFANADSYLQKFPFLSRLELREGAVDLGKRIPPSDTTLIATTAALLVRRDAHPALVNLLAQSLHEVHGGTLVDNTGQTPLFQRAGEFPTAVDPEFQMSDEARRVYRSGPPFLQRYLPFWLATMIDRLLVSLVVILPLLIPASRLGPQIYRWRVRRRLLTWYRELRELEGRVRNAATAEERTRHIAELDRIETAVDNINVPFGYTDQHFELRQNIDAVRARLTTRLARAAA